MRSSHAQQADTSFEFRLGVESGTIIADAKTNAVIDSLERLIGQLCLGVLGDVLAVNVSDPKAYGFAERKIGGELFGSGSERLFSFWTINSIESNPF